MGISPDCLLFAVITYIPGLPRPLLAADLLTLDAGLGYADAACAGGTQHL